MTLPESKLAHHQAISDVRRCPETGDLVRVVLRYDDRCGNGHNTFSITADVWEGGRAVRSEPDRCGCCHEDVARVFPEYAHLIKWHLTSSDEPMHYVANTLYHARDREYMNKAIGEPVRWEKRLGFIGCPFTFKLRKSAIDFILAEKAQGHPFEPEQVPNTENPELYSPNYTLKGYKGDHSNAWVGALWNNHQDAMDFVQALNTYEPVTVDIPTAWNKAETPNLEAARVSAVWPDATLEQLQDKAALEARLPELMQQFKADMEALGFTY